MTETAHNPDQRVPCAVPACGTMFPVREMASLTDKHDHGWYICPDCIDKLWKQGHPFLADPVETVYGSVTDHLNLSTGAELEKVTLTLATLVGSMAALRDQLDYLSPISRETVRRENLVPVIAAMDRELAKARKVYSGDGS
jgi:hypothetical protein